VLGGAACSAGAPGGDVPREVGLDVFNDGSIVVEETIEPAAATRGDARRRIVEPARVDRVTFLDAVEEAGAAPPGLDARATAGGRGLEVRWAASSSGRIRLRYRVEGALEIVGRQLQLTWRAVPGDRADDLDHVRVTLRLPSTVTLLTPSGMAEAGWAVAVQPGRLDASRPILPRDEPATLMALLAGDLPLAEPAWQMAAARAAHLAPAFVAGGLFLLTVAVGIVTMLWAHDRRAPGRTRLLTADTAAQLRIAGWVCLAAGLAMSLATYALSRRFGPSPHALSAAIFLSGMLFLRVAGSAHRHRQSAYRNR
jgi:hypothetical protein